MTPALVLHYANATHLGGAERCMLEAIMRYGERPELGFTHRVIVPKSEGPLVDRFREAGIAYDVLPMPPALLQMNLAERGSTLWRFLQQSLPLARYVAELERLVRDRRPDVVHSNGLKCHALAALATRDVPLLWHLRDMVHGSKRALLRLLQRRRRAHVVACSQATLASFVPAAGRRLHVSRDGIPASAYAPRRHRRLATLFADSPERPIVGILGALTRWKGHLEFVRMAAELRRRGVDACFLIVGGEIYDTAGETGHGRAIWREVERLGLADRVRMTGFLADPADTVNGLDVLVHASVRPEPFGRVVIEAMACGTPLVASAAGGVLEIVEPGVTGELAPPGDVRALADAVQRLLEDRARAAAQAAAARRSYLERFTLDRHIEELAAIYGATMRGDAPATAPSLARSAPGR